MSREMVTHPDHYQSDDGDFEAIDVIAHSVKYLDGIVAFEVGNAAKYLLRLGRKDDILQELRKADNYLQMAIEYLQRHGYGSKESDFEEGQEG